MLRKIVSGGQTGADRAALDAALEQGLKIGGWIPKGRLAEDGLIPDRYRGLHEADSAEPSVRTALNVRDSDATLIVSQGPLEGGSLLTFQEARRLERPVLHIDLSATPEIPPTNRLSEWLRRVSPSTLNVAGPRASEDGELYPSVVKLLRSVLPQAGSNDDQSASTL